MQKQECGEAGLPDVGQVRLQAAWVERVVRSGAVAVQWVCAEQECCAAARSEN